MGRKGKSQSRNSRHWKMKRLAPLGIMLPTQGGRSFTYMYDALIYGTICCCPSGYWMTKHF